MRPGGNPELDTSHLEPYKWKKGGPSPNPGGRRRTRIASELLTRLFDCEIPADILKKLNGRKRRARLGSLPLPAGSTFGSALCLRIFLKALDGDMYAAKLAMSYLEGFPNRRLEVSGGMVNANVDIGFIRNKLEAALSGKNTEHLQLESENSGHA